MQNNKLIIFDLDGTLFRTETVDVKALNRALEENGYAGKSEAEILSYIGLVMEDICKALLQTEDQKTLAKFRQDVIRLEYEEITKSGMLYPKVEDFLRKLSELGYSLCICSNGNKEYVTAISEKFEFNKIFDYIWYEEKGISKIQAVGIIRDRYHCGGFIMVGDRSCDIEAGRVNGGITIGTQYGFGEDEVLEADFVASSIQELESIILNIDFKHK